jgi:hypothetical protein
MRIVGCDLHARQQTLAMLDTTTGEVVNTTLKQAGSMVRKFYANLPRPARVGVEATGFMQWFVNLMEELGIECLVGHRDTGSSATQKSARATNPESVYAQRCRATCGSRRANISSGARPKLKLVDLLMGTIGWPATMAADFPTHGGHSSLQATGDLTNRRAESDPSRDVFSLGETER